LFNYTGNLERKMDSVLETQTSVLETHTSVLAALKKTEQVNSIIVPLVCNMAIKDNNLWTHTQIADSETRRNETYRKDLLKYLGYNPKKRMDYPCMLTGQKGNGDFVVAAHLAPARSKIKILNQIGMKESDISDPRNFLLLASNIEKAYDSLQLSFIKENALSTRLVMKIWDDTIRKNKIWPNSNLVIGSYEGRPLNLGRHKPFKRALSFQAYQAYLKFSYIENEIRLEYGSDDQTEYAKERRLMKENVLRDIRDEIGSDDDI